MSSVSANSLDANHFDAITHFDPRFKIASQKCFGLGFILTCENSSRNLLLPSQRQMHGHHKEEIDVQML